MMTEHALKTVGQSAQALVQGGVFEWPSPREVADQLRLPMCGPFVAVAADVPASGEKALRGIDAKLRSLDIFSAWVLLPDQHVGIVQVPSDLHLERLLALLSRTATTRVGVSARFDDLAETAHALRYARVLLEGRPEPGDLVTVFDGSILGSAAISAPEVMMKAVAPMLEQFADLSADQRQILFDTFRVWQLGGSLQEVADQLFCHPNTVRYRLHRIQQRTGRSLSRPRDVAELCLICEVERRLM